jgi:hypothetical protein
MVWNARTSYTISIRIERATPDSAGQQMLLAAGQTTFKLILCLRGKQHLLSR